MDKVLNGIHNKDSIAYFDDIVFSETFDDHMKQLVDVFQQLANAGLKLKLSKCEFLKPNCRYLGHEIFKDGVKPNP